MKLDNFVRRGEMTMKLDNFVRRGEMTLMQNFFLLARSQSSLWLGTKTYIVNMSTKCIDIYILYHVKVQKETKKK